jgi:hypothetical protein
MANSFHSSHKSGFKSMLETRVAASMQNIFPAPFGKTAGEKLDDNESLLGYWIPTSLTPVHRITTVGNYGDIQRRRPGR